MDPPCDTPPPEELLLTECTETFEYVDGYGNVTKHETTCNNGAEMSSTETQFTPDRNAWLISNPELITITSDRAGVPGGTQTQTWDPEYDEHGLLESMTRVGDAAIYHKTAYVRDDYGNITEMTESVLSGEGPRKTEITYDLEKIHPFIIKNALGHKTTGLFDRTTGALKSIVDPNGVAVRHGYDELGRRVETRDANGTTVYTYIRIQSNQAEAETAAGSIDPRLKIRISRQAGESRIGDVEQEFDGRGRLVRTRTEGFGGVEIIEESAYDPLGRLSGSTLAHTADANAILASSYHYDGLQRLTRVERSDGTHVDRHYASRASLIAERQNWLSGMPCIAGRVCPVGVELWSDEEGKRDVRVTDHAGLVLRSIDGRNVDTVGSVTTYDYGPFRRPVRIWQSGEPAYPPAGFTTFTAYDAYGRLKSYSATPGVAYTFFSHNGYDEVVRRTAPDTSVRTFGYDDLGRRTTIIDASGTTSWSYDDPQNGIGRLSAMFSPATAQNPAGQQVRYVYEPVAETNRGQLERMEYTIDGVQYSVSFDYDALGRTKRVDYPDLGNGSAVAIEYLYDPQSGILSGLDKVGASNTPLWRLEQAVLGHLPKIESFGNGSVTTYGYYEGRQWLKSISTTLGSTNVQDHTYTYWDNGLIQDRKSGIITRKHDYDDLNRLSITSDTSESGAVFPPVQYHYDGLGNLIQRGATAITFRQDKPHLVDTVFEAGDNEYEYDANGNVEVRSGPGVPGGTQTISYTPFDLPREILTATGSAVRFEYSADEERLVRRHTLLGVETTRHFVSDLYQRSFVGDASTAETLEERYRVFAGTRLIAEVVRKDGVADQTLFFHDNHQGTPTAITTDSGQLFEQNFTPFGAAAASNEPDPRLVGSGSSIPHSACLMDRSTWGESMEFRRPTADERRLLLELARIAHIDSPESWLDALQVREMKDGSMGSLELAVAARNAARSGGVVISKASVQFADEDGVQVVATLNASEDGVPFELDVWKTDFTPLKRIPTAFQRIED